MTEERRLSGRKARQLLPTELLAGICFCGSLTHTHTQSWRNASHIHPHRRYPYSRTTGSPYCHPQKFYGIEGETSSVWRWQRCFFCPTYSAVALAIISLSAETPYSPLFLPEQPLSFYPQVLGLSPSQKMQRKKKEVKKQSSKTGEKRKLPGSTRTPQTKYSPRFRNLFWPFVERALRAVLATLSAKCQPRILSNSKANKAKAAGYEEQNNKKNIYISKMGTGGLLNWAATEVEMLIRWGFELYKRNKICKKK